MRCFRNFVHADHGAVTIDWVALAAGLLILGIGIVNLLAGSVQGVVDGIETQLTQATQVSAPVENGAAGDDTLAGAIGGGGDDTPPAGPEIQGTVDGRDYYASACSGSICWIDTTGDGQSNYRVDNGQTYSDQNIDVAQRVADGDPPLS